MSSEATKVIRYNDNNYHMLMAEFKTLSTFAHIAAWDEQAKAEVEKTISTIQALDTEIVQQTEALEQAKRAHTEKSFLNRMFSGRKEEKDVAQHVEQCQKLKASLETLASEMQEAIDFSPNSPEEQKALLKELRQRKKELQVQKREVAASMKAIRGEAQQQSVHAGKGFLGTYNSKLATYQRRQIRYAKQAALGPEEDEKAAVERQILQVERDILWAERFKE